MRYVAHRLGRLPGTPYRIAAGFACGAAISFTPFIGFHILLAMLLALMIRGNLIASGIGTVVGNPWTFPLIWLWVYTLGRWLLGLEGSGDLPDQLTFIYIRDHPMHVLWPMTVGGIPTAIMAWVVFFLPMRRLVEEYQRARRWRIRRKVLRRRQRAKTAHLAELSTEQLRDKEEPR
ncbi:MAG: DUF2062 domain-containing protein [Rhodospirillales bacterium]|nr:DUF2062 domain-containing protein [Rhodospirillales bacterium]